MSKTNVNAVTVEMIKSRLVAIGDEMVSTMVRTAGTPIYAEIKDFSCGLFDYKARQVVYSGLAVTHNLAIQNLLQTSMARYGDNQGIYDGDLFIGNDPYYGGGIHAPELGLASPIFVDGEILAWSGSIAHQLDIGGMTPGGFCMDATDCFQEGIRFPPVKLYRAGELQQDIWDIHQNNVRVPEKIGMELKGQIAANNVAKRRIRELVDRFGAETVKKACDALIALSSRVTEEKIRQLPEGKYRHTDFEEAEGMEERFFPINCDLTVRDGQLIFDFTRECPPQLPKAINCTRLVVRGMVLSHIMPLLCHDVPWNEGCTYPIDILTTPGTILDARPPAPCSNPNAGLRAADGALCAFNKALKQSPLEERITACWDGSPPIVVGMAPGPPGHPPMVIPMLEGMSGGGGAFSMKDGLDAGSMLSIMAYSMGDVEIQENAYPLLYLTRRFLKDSGGAGRFRGGSGTVIAVAPRNVQGLRFFLLQDRRLIPSHGAMGGYPGASHHLFVSRNMDMTRAIKEGFGESEDALPPAELLPIQGILDLGPDDVFAFTSNAGGGYGDPLNRDPNLVARDVIWEFVSEEKAGEIYGVFFDPETKEVDELKTSEERERIRLGRTGKRADQMAEILDPQGDGIEISGLDEGIGFRCKACGRDLCGLGENWKEAVIYQTIRMDAVNEYIPGDDRVLLRRSSCPHCGLLLDSEITLKGLPPQRDFELLT